MSLFQIQNHRRQITLIGLFCGLFCASGWAASSPQSATGDSSLSASAAPGNDQGTKGTGSAGKSRLPASLFASAAPGNDQGTKGTGSAGKSRLSHSLFASAAPGNDQGTKGTGSAGKSLV